MFSKRWEVKMDERMKIYTAENGELKHDTGSSNKGEIDRRIHKDRESRLLLQYSPEGVIRYFFYARRKGRPEQYIAEYSLSGAEDLKSNRQKRDRFLSVLFPDRLSTALDVLDYELDESHWESQTSDLLENKQQISKPKMSDEGKRALNMGSSAEVAVPDMESALWIIFNVIPSSKSVIVSEGGYLDHRGEDDFLLQVDRMRNEVEPIKSSKEKIDRSILKKKTKDSKKILNDLQKGPRNSATISEALNSAGISDRLGIDVYSKSEKGSIRVQYAALSLLGVIPVIAVAWFLEIVTFENLTDPVVLGEPVATVLGPLGPYVVQSHWILLTVGASVLYVVLSRAPVFGDTAGKAIGLITGGNTSTGRKTQRKAKDLVSTLAEVRRRGSTQDVRNILREGTPNSLAVDRGSRSSFRRKNSLVGIGIGALLVLVVALLVVSALTLLGWSFLMGIAIVSVIVFWVYEVIRAVLPSKKTRSPRGGRKGGL
jgi:hypothetical protein